jgi:Fic family protein
MELIPMENSDYTYNQVYLMEIQKFGPNKSGRLIKITGLTGIDYAFIPNPLPPNWNWPTSLWPLLLKARTALASLDGVGKYLPNPELLLSPLRNQEAIRSSSLEGTYATPEQLILFQINSYKNTIHTENINSFREVNNYAQAIRYYFDGKSKLPISLRLIRELHRMLLTGVRGKDKLPGEFRRTQNQIGIPARFVPPPPDKLLECLDNLEKYLYEDSQYDPLVKAFIVHYQFEAIHPFLDGNGRIGRLLLAILIKEWCALKNQWLYMSTFFDNNRDQYIDKLFTVSKENDWNAWIEFCLSGVIQQANETQNRCDKLISLSNKFKKRLLSSSGSIRLSSIADSLFITPFIRIPYIAKKFNVDYKTAESDIKKLVSLDILKRIGNSTQKTYYSPEIVRIAFVD